MTSLHMQNLVGYIWLYLIYCTFFAERGRENNLFFNFLSQFYSAIIFLATLIEMSSTLVIYVPSDA